MTIRFTSSPNNNIEFNRTEQHVLQGEYNLEHGSTINSQAYCEMPCNELRPAIKRLHEGFNKTWSFSQHMIIS